MRTYDAIDKVSKAIIEDGLCDAILLKGSIGRQDDDEYSDIDMYAIVKEEEKETFLKRRLNYMETYMTLIYSSEVYFVTEQIVGIYENGLHMDLYTVTEKALSHIGKAKVLYDPLHKFDLYEAEVYTMEKEELVKLFGNILYSFVEADSAYCRKNYPWTARIMNQAIAESATLLRYIYDKEEAYLGLKKLNQLIPKEQFDWFEIAYANLNKDGFGVSNKYILTILDFVIEHIDHDISEGFDYKFYSWIKESLGKRIFVIEKNDI